MDFSKVYPDTCSTTAVAARGGHLDVLQNLIKLGKSVDVRDNRGWIALHEAASSGHVECLKLILQQDVELVDFRTFQEETALLLACRAAKPQCTSLLLESGANPNSTTFEGYSALWEATSSQNLECVQLLIKAGAKLDQQIFTGDTPLHIATQNDSVDIVSTLLEAGADITVKTENEITPLFVAAQFGKLQCFRLLIEAASCKGEAFKVDYINTPAFDKATPLYLAAQEGHDKCVDLLLKHGANPYLYVRMDAKSGHYLFPLQAAIAKNNVKCVELLVDATDMEVFDRAVYKSNKRLIDGLERQPSACFQPLYMAMDHEDGACLRLLISHGYLRQYQNRVRDQTIGNVFQTVPLKLKPVVIFVKCCEDWVRRQYEMGSWDLYSAALFENSYETRNKVLVILLWMGAPCNSLLHRRTVISWKTLEQMILLYKYLKAEKLCDDCSTAGRRTCIENLETLRPHDFESIDKTLLLKLCFTPNFLKFDNRIYEVLQRQSQESGDHRSDPKDETPGKRVLQTPPQIVQNCRDSLNTLQHMCRVHIMYHLLHANNYTKEATLSLGLPTQLQRYLLYCDLGDTGKTLVKATKEVQDIERQVMYVYEETDVSDIVGMCQIDPD